MYFPVKQSRVTQSRCALHVRHAGARGEGRAWRTEEQDALGGASQAALGEEGRLLQRQLHHLPQHHLRLAQRAHLLAGRSCHAALCHLASCADDEPEASTIPQHACVRSDMTAQQSDRHVIGKHDVP